MTREFLDDVDLFRAKYIRSIQQAIKLRNRVGDRFAIFDLEVFKATDDQHSHIRDQILSPLGIEDRLRWFEGDVPNTNSAAQLGLKLVSGGLVDEQMAALRADEKISENRHKLLG